jgi:NAD(P)-dependent dehydrogenase (short-subunit alcohol dehydrogenase family)
MPGDEVSNLQFQQLHLSNPEGNKQLSTMDKKIVVVIGATGQQGGSVVSALLQSDHYTVRGVTRNIDSGASQALIARGVDMVVADLEKVEELKTAFQVTISQPPGR